MLVSDSMTKGDVPNLILTLGFLCTTGGELVARKPGYPASGRCGPASNQGEVQVAETILLHQRESGGWPKNYDRTATLTEGDRQRLRHAAARNDATVDNGATHTEIRILSQAYRRYKDRRFKEAALRGIRYLLVAQYANGGWPQRFPDPSGYKRHITFNDNAMIGIMKLLSDIANHKSDYRFVGPRERKQCQEAVGRGIACILKCQIRAGGRLTVWCAQHDALTMAPRGARPFELASLSGSESVGIVRFLMNVRNPDPKVVAAIEAAVDWFEGSKLEGIRLERRADDSSPRGFDLVVVEDPGAPSMWARFYDIETNQPIFCSRDGVPRRKLSEISQERRTGYSWLGTYAEELLGEDLPAWRRRVEQ